MRHELPQRADRDAEGESAQVGDDPADCGRRLRHHVPVGASAADQEPHRDHARGRRRRGRRGGGRHGESVHERHPGARLLCPLLSRQEVHLDSDRVRESDHSEWRGAESTRRPRRLGHH